MAFSVPVVLGGMVFAWLHELVRPSPTANAVASSARTGRMAPVPTSRLWCTMVNASLQGSALSHAEPHDCAGTTGQLPASRRVVGEDVVVILEGLVADEAALEHRLVGQGFAVVELGVSPAAGRSVSLGVLHHELDSVLGGTGHERLALAE